MTEAKSVLETWEEVIVDFLTGKEVAEEEKYIKDEIKNIADYYKRQNYYDQQDIEEEKQRFSVAKQRGDRNQPVRAFAGGEICNRDGQEQQ